MDTVIWQDRLCKFEGKYLMLSAVGDHKKFDYGTCENTGAISLWLSPPMQLLNGKLVHAAEPDITRLEVIDDALIIRTSSGFSWAVVGNPWNGRFDRLL